MSEVNSGNPDFDVLLQRMADICRVKNHDYARPEEKDFYSNFRSVERLGIPAWKGILVRMSDKWSRIVELSRKTAEVEDESVEDTLLDLANYALFCILVRREKMGDK